MCASAREPKKFTVEVNAFAYANENKLCTRHTHTHTPHVNVRHSCVSIEGKL